MADDETVKATGPLFNGKAERAFKDYAIDAEQYIAEQAVGEVRRQLDRVLKHPTGKYKRSIRVEKKGSMHTVSDGNIVYGPWLEGVSSRNEKSRFKGYRTFRIVKQRIDRRAEADAEKRLPRYLGRAQ
jgi:hypothetical protein